MEQLEEVEEEVPQGISPEELESLALGDGGESRDWGWGGSDAARMIDIRMYEQAMESRSKLSERLSEVTKVGGSGWRLRRAYLRPPFGV